MTEDSTFTLDLLPGQIHGNDLIEISKPIKQQNMRITGYSVTTVTVNDNKKLEGGIYIKADEINNVSHLMDNNKSLNALVLETTDNSTQTFVPDCYKIFKMNRDLDHSFYINCYFKGINGVFTKVASSNFPDIRIRIVFVLQSLE